MTILPKFVSFYGIGKIVSLCMLCNFACFLSFADFFFFFSKSSFSKNSFRNTIRVTNSLDPDQARQNGSKLFAKVICRRHCSSQGAKTLLFLFIYSSQFNRKKCHGEILFKALKITFFDICVLVHFI